VVGKEKMGSGVNALRRSYSKNSISREGVDTVKNFFENQRQLQTRKERVPTPPKNDNQRPCGKVKVSGTQISNS